MVSVIRSSSPPWKVGSNKFGDPVADKLLGALQGTTEGMTCSEIRSQVFQRHVAAARIKAVLDILLEDSLVREVLEDTVVRTVSRYYATKQG